jgi:hypothetical protein
MATRTTPAARPHPDSVVDADGLVREIETYLARQPFVVPNRPAVPAAPAGPPARRTAHRLVTKSTQELVDEALGQIPAPPATTAPALTAPSALLRHLPDWVLRLPVLRQAHGGGRELHASEYLELTALVIERFGWHQGDLRGKGGGRCILGAQQALHRLGYGTPHTHRQAAAALNTALSHSGGGSYETWNDRPGRTLDQVLTLLRSTATALRKDHR